MKQYKATKKSDNFFGQSKTLTEIKREDGMSWLNEVGAKPLQYALRCVDAAYVNFFNGKCKFPRFKSRRGKNSFTVCQRVSLKNNKVHVSKFKEGIECITHREVKGKITKMTFSKTPTGKYFVSILSEETYIPKEKTGKSCGIDLGLKNLIITSDGITYKNNKYTKQYELKLATAQKHLSRKITGSKSSENQRRKVARIHEKISNSRRDNLHKISNQLVTDYDIICIETLNVKGLVKNRKLSKHISDAGWGMFVGFLTYKSGWNDKTIVKIDRFFPSSKTCNVCGWINKDLNLSDREWTCANGHVLDRDDNAAQNILNEGLKILSAGTVDYTGGDSNKTSLEKRKSVKPEACLT